MAGRPGSRVGAFTLGFSALLSAPPPGRCSPSSTASAWALPFLIAALGFRRALRRVRVSAPQRTYGDAIRRGAAGYKQVSCAWGHLTGMLRSWVADCQPAL